MKTFKFFKMLAVLIVLITSINTAWASTSVTFYLAVDAAKTRNNNNCCNVQAQIKYGGGGDNDNWSEWMNMTITSHTYNGKLVYSQSFTFNYDGWHCWQFRMEENGNQHWYKSIYCGAWQTDCHNGDLYDYENSTWVKSPSWDESYKIYFSNQWDWGAIRAYAWNNDCDHNEDHPGSTLESTGCKHNGHDVYRLTLDKRFSKIQFNCNSDNCKEDNQDCYSNRGKQFGGGEGWYTPTFDGYTFSSGATVVWDAGNESWTSAYLYNFDLDGDNDITLTRIGSTTQFYKTATSNVKTGAWILRNAQDFNHAQTTDITSDISGVTLFNYCNTKTSSKLDWQKTTNAKKATGSKKIYFDNSDAMWSNIYLKYGTQWFTRATSAATKVTGTANLYYITIPNDAYYKEYFLCDATGSTGYNNIETMTSIGNRIAYQPYNYAADSTFIPTAGTGSSPKVWNTMTKMAGHTHNVTITAPSHGSITVGYTDESSASQSFTSGDVDVARTCTLTVSSSPSTGYNRGSLTINGNNHTSGSSYTIRQDITVEATFTPMSCSITFDKNGGEGGADGTTATYDADMTRVTVPHIIGYRFDGYYDGETDGNGSGTKYYNADGTSAKPWDVATESSQTLYAKWVSDTKRFVGSSSKDWATASNWEGGVVPTNDWSIVTIARDVDINYGTSVHVGQVLISSGTLEINGGGSLEVGGTITKANGDATETTDLIVSSEYRAQGALIFDNSAGTTKATVDMFTTATKEPSGYVFQMCAVPMTIVNVSESFAGQGVYTYAWVEGTGWERRNYYYAVFANEAVALTQTGDNSFYYFFRGTLASTNNLNLSLTKTGTDSNAAGVNLFGNSWTAPIRIDKCVVSEEAIQTIYIYEDGDWATYTISSAGESDVIPAMQAFAVLLKDDESSGTLSINYDAAVRGVPEASRTAALRAPKRNIMAGMNDVYLRVSDGERATNLRLCESEQFTDEFDNGWEAPYLEGDRRSGQLYAQADDKMAVLATPDLEGTVVGFLPGNASNYTISFSGDETGYYLNDTELELSTLIAEGNTYEFTPNENTNATRFVISKTPIRNTPTSIKDVNDSTKARKQLIDGVLYIIRDGRIYNTTGALYK